MTSWQRAVKYIATAFAVFLIVSIIGGICSVFAGISFFSGKSSIAGETKTYDIDGEIEDLDIDISFADLVIKTDEDFKVQSNHKYLTVEQKNGRLVISEKKRLFGSYSDNVKLELYIPENTVFKKAEIVTGAGRVTVDTLAADTLYLELGAGEVKIDTLTANDRADIDGGAGKVTVGGGTLCDADIDMGVGELKLTSRLIGESSLDYGMGAASLTLLGSVDDYRIEIDNGLGKATVDGKEMTDGKVYGSGENEIEIDGGIGEMKIDFKQAE